MAQKMENWQFPVEGKRGKNSQDYSKFIELAEEEKKSKEDIVDRINERTKFLETEEAKLAMLEDDPASNAKEIEEQRKLVNNINDEVMELSKKIPGIEKKVDLHLKDDKATQNMLERFKPDIEH